MLHLWRPIAIATCAVVVGTILGRRVLDRIPETQFRQIVAVLLALLGTAMLVKGLEHSGG